MPWGCTWRFLHERIMNMWALTLLYFRRILLPSASSGYTLRRPSFTQLFTECRQDKAHRLSCVSVHHRLPDWHGDGARRHETAPPDAGRLPRSLPQCHPCPLQSHPTLPEHIQREAVRTATGRCYGSVHRWYVSQTFCCIVYSQQHHLCHESVMVRMTRSLFRDDIMPSGVEELRKCLNDHVQQSILSIKTWNDHAFFQILK